MQAGLVTLRYFACSPGNKVTCSIISKTEVGVGGLLLTRKYITYTVRYCAGCPMTPVRLCPCVWSVVVGSASNTAVVGNKFGPQNVLES